SAKCLRTDQPDERAVPRKATFFSIFWRVGATPWHAFRIVTIRAVGVRSEPKKRQRPATPVRALRIGRVKIVLLRIRRAATGTAAAFILCMALTLADATA